MRLSEIFKYTQGLGQRGHQIGRKVGDALELLTFGMIDLDTQLRSYMVIENGVEGASTAEHKVEFAFYNKDQYNLVPIKIPENLYGIIECKKVGVEQTTKNSFKTWERSNRGNFHNTSGFSFPISFNGNPRWQVTVEGVSEGGNNIRINVRQGANEEIYQMRAPEESQILLALDETNHLHILPIGTFLSSIERPLEKCIIIQILKTDAQENITKINVNEALPGPQTPEKAKQSSFVSLDVRKKVLGHFDKTDDKAFISVLVIAEADHWEEKSRNMIRLCNDDNLYIPCKVIVYFLTLFLERFGEAYQDSITKSAYLSNQNVRNIVRDTIIHFEYKILFDLETNRNVFFKHEHHQDGSNRLIVKDLDYIDELNR